MTAAEAILAGRPLITNPVVPALELLRPACVAARTDDVDSHHEAVLKLATDAELYARLCRACPDLRAPFYDRHYGLTAVLKRGAGPCPASRRRPARYQSGEPNPGGRSHQHRSGTIRSLLKAGKRQENTDEAPPQTNDRIFWRLEGIPGEGTSGPDRLGRVGTFPVPVATQAVAPLDRSRNRGIIPVMSCRTRSRSRRDQDQCPASCRFARDFACESDTEVSGHRVA